MRALLTYYWRRWVWKRWMHLDNEACDEFRCMGGPEPLACRDVSPYDRVYLIECHNGEWWYMYPNGDITLAWSEL